MTTHSTTSAPSPPRAAALFKFTFALSLIALAFASTYASSARAFSEADLKNILALGGAVNAALLLGILFFLRRCRWLANAALALATLTSVGSAHLVHTELYVGSNWVVLVLLSLAAGAALFVAFRIIDEQRWGGIVLSATALIGLAIVVDAYKMDRAAPVFGAATNLREISFQETPNLYFISFDAIAPRALLNKHLRLETTDFHDLFEERFRRFPNLFTEAGGTVQSIESILSLDPSQLRSLRKWEDGRAPGSLFSGQKPSPLFGILRKNGYETTTIYRYSMFGPNKGPYVDNYIVTYKHTVCNLLAPEVRALSFWGYCSRVNFEERRFDDRAVDDRAEELTAALIRKVDVSGGPQFVMAHLNYPGHIQGGPYRHGFASYLETYRREYRRRSDFAARQLDAIVRHLEKNDPGAILLVYGDHGTWVSAEVGFADNPTFVIQANYGVLGGVYPSDACAAWFDEAEAARNYMTVLDAVHALLRCLSGGESALAKPRDRTILFGWAKGHDLSIFEEHLYE